MDEKIEKQSWEFVKITFQCNFIRSSQLNKHSLHHWKIPVTYVRTAIRVCT